MDRHINALCERYNITGFMHHESVSSILCGTCWTMNMGDSSLPCSICAEAQCRRKQGSEGIAKGLAAHTISGRIRRCARVPPDASSRALYTWRVARMRGPLGTLFPQGPRSEHACHTGTGCGEVDTKPLSSALPLLAESAKKAALASANLARIGV